jgi:hypothetical protein
MTTTVSFKKITEADPAPVSVTESPESQSLTIPAASAPAVYQGTADDHDGVDASDIKLPKLKLLQGTSDKKLLAAHGFGTLLLKDLIPIAKTRTETSPAIPGTLVFVRLISKTYTEKVAKFGDPSLYARSLAEVEEMGGTSDWRLSKENRRGSSTKPWFQVNANCLVLVQKPEGADDDHFPFEADGKYYAPALYSVKSFAYERFFMAVATAKAAGELRKDGYSSRFIRFISEIEPGKGNAEFAVPSISFGEATPESVRRIAANLS